MIVSKPVTFNQLSVGELYRILQLRSEVFVVEQNCIYQDIDGADTDPDTLHVLLLESEELVAYARILQVDEKRQIGRIVVSPKHRKNGIGKVLVKRCLELTEGKEIFIEAQAHLQEFYQSLGFVRDPKDDVYLEDGIPHVHMNYSSDK